jgi:hypothetical protein
MHPCLQSWCHSIRPLTEPATAIRETRNTAGDAGRANEKHGYLSAGSVCHIDLLAAPQLGLDPPTPLSSSSRLHSEPRPLPCPHRCDVGAEPSLPPTASAALAAPAPPPPSLASPANASHAWCCSSNTRPAEVSPGLTTSEDTPPRISFPAAITRRAQTGHTRVRHDKSSLKPMGYSWSHSACRIGQLVPIWQPHRGFLIQVMNTLSRARSGAGLSVCLRRKHESALAIGSECRFAAWTRGCG